MQMNKNSALIDSIKAKMGAEKSPGIATIPVTRTTGTFKAQAPAGSTSGKGKAATTQQVRDMDAILSEGGFVQLSRKLEAAREDLDIDRKIVYIDEESAEVLELLRKKARIKANVLVSCLLHEFFQKHKKLIQELLEKRSNKLLDQ